MTMRAAALALCQRWGNAWFHPHMAPGLACSISAVVQTECGEGKNWPMTPKFSATGGMRHCGSAQAYWGQSPWADEPRFTFYKLCEGQDTNILSWLSQHLLTPSLTFSYDGGWEQYSRTILFSQRLAVCLSWRPKRCRTKFPRKVLFSSSLSQIASQTGAFPLLPVLLLASFLPPDLARRGKNEKTGAPAATLSSWGIKMTH